MKNSLSNHYKAVFREYLFPYGFRLYKKTFYRVINDVMQTLMLSKTSTNFTLVFNVLPLSLPIDNLYCEGYSISTFRKGGWWDCGDGAETKAFDDISSLFKQYVLPIFENGIDAESAYHELVKHEKMVFSSVPGGVIMNNYHFVCLCIQAQDYEQAFQHMAAIIKQNIGGVDFEKFIVEWLKGKDLSIEKFLPRIQERIKLMQKLALPDVEYLQNFVIQNKAKSLEFLKSPK